MDPFATSHFSHKALLLDLKAQVALDFRTTAILLSRIAEVDRRRLYAGEGYSSMHGYCVHELHFSEDAAYRRVTAARTARQFPALLVAVADGRLHLTAVLMLAPHLTSGNADDLVAAATHKSRAEIDALLAQHFPRPDLPEGLQAIPMLASPIPAAAQPASGLPVQLAPARVAATMPDEDNHGGFAASYAPAPQLAPARVDSSAPRAKITPLAPQRFGLQVTLDQETHDLLERARALMGHQNPAGEIASVLKRALELLVGQLEKRKFAATARPGPSRPATSARHIPAAVKRVVRERDGDRCTFIGDSGRRCAARRLLEFDHREPVARGGETTAENLRLVCRAHNQHAAECTFGAAFMEGKRAEAHGAGHKGNGAGVLSSRTCCLPT